MKFGIKDETDVVLKDNETGEITFEGKAHSVNLDENTQVIRTFVSKSDLTYGEVTIGFDKEIVESNQKLKELLNSNKK